MLQLERVAYNKVFFLSLLVKVSDRWLSRDGISRTFNVGLLSVEGLLGRSFTIFNGVSEKEI